MKLQQIIRAISVLSVLEKEYKTKREEILKQQGDNPTIDNTKRYIELDLKIDHVNEAFQSLMKVKKELE